MSSSRLIVITEGQLKEILEDLIADVIDRKFDEKELEQTKQSEKEDRLFSVKEIAEFLGVAQITIHRWKRRGLLPYKKIGKRVFFDQRKVMEALKDYKLDFNSGS